MSPAAAGNPFQITVKFDQIEVNKRPVTISVGLRAYATMELVAQSRQPANANGGNGTSVWDLNLSQIGGQIAYNGQKVVKGNGQVVGRIPEPGAVLAVPMANPEFGCAGPGANKSEQAFWAFSTNACGIYGDDSMTTGQRHRRNKSRTDRVQVAQEDHRKRRQRLAAASELDRTSLFAGNIRNLSD